MLPIKAGNRYEIMLDETNKLFPQISQTIESFNKPDSQIKITTLNINDLTDIGSAKHIVAVIDRTRKALKESEISVRRKKIDIKKKKKQVELATDIEKDELELDILELESQIEDIQAAQRGAIRDYAFMAEQYKSICDKLGVEIITQEMYEKDQSKYHVMRATSQALAAARARGGLIDEGNFIYFQDLGINGAAIQRELTAYLEMEQEIINAGQVPTFELQASWIEAIGEKFSGEVSRYAESRGFKPFVPQVLAQETFGEIDSVHS